MVAAYELVILVEASSKGFAFLDPYSATGMRA